MAKKHYRKPHSYKRKKSIFKQRLFWFSILGILLLCGVFYSLFFLQLFQVEKIIVNGNSKVEASDVKSLVENKIDSKILFFGTKSIFAVKTSQIRENLLNLFPQIAEAKVSRGFLDAIIVSLVERQGMAIWCQAENCFLIDKAGVIFESVKESSDLLELRNSEYRENIALGEVVLSSEKMSQIIQIKGGLDFPVIRVLLVSEERLNVETAEGWEIYFNLKGDLNWQLTELSLVLEKQISAQERTELQYIDLRFSRVFYK
ncbi:MAG: FtsQ-type POTRA domain-containing protein [Candidatus Nealsonbacteria bacterium]